MGKHNSDLGRLVTDNLMDFYIQVLNGPAGQGLGAHRVRGSLIKRDESGRKVTATLNPGV